MNMKTIALLMIYSLSGACLASACSLQKESKSASDILKKLNEQNQKIKNFSANITSTFEQPLLESATIRKGVISYAKDVNDSFLYIDFKTRQDDDQKAEDDRQKYIFDGVWLTRTNYTTSHVEKRQLTDVNSPVDVIGLLSRSFPLVGFSGSESLKQEFEIELVLEKDKKFEHLRLIPKEESKYYEDYLQIDFWVDNKLGLPTRIETLTSEEDIYKLTLKKIKINQKKEKLKHDDSFPKVFTMEIIPLK